jgi:hypothetical protein
MKVFYFQIMDEKMPNWMKKEKRKKSKRMKKWHVFGLDWVQI